jgi:hypothetical protein
LSPLIVCTIQKKLYMILSVSITPIFVFRRAA